LELVVLELLQVPQELAVKVFLLMPLLWQVMGEVVVHVQVILQVQEEVL
jgi:hypothetical protein